MSTIGLIVGRACQNFAICCLWDMWHALVGNRRNKNLFYWSWSKIAKELHCLLLSMDCDVWDWIQWIVSLEIERFYLSLHIMGISTRTKNHSFKKKEKSKILCSRYSERNEIFVQCTYALDRSHVLCQKQSICIFLYFAFAFSHEFLSSLPPNWSRASTS